MNKDILFFIMAAVVIALSALFFVILRKYERRINRMREVNSELLERLHLSPGFKNEREMRSQFNTLRNDFGKVSQKMQACLEVIQVRDSRIHELQQLIAKANVDNGEWSYKYDELEKQFRDNLTDLKTVEQSLNEANAALERFKK